MPWDSISSVDPTTGNIQNQASISSDSDEIGQEAFLQLLLAQLQNQDPLKPMEDTEFIAQLAQFNSLNELAKINETLTVMMSSQNLSQASALIGKNVTGLTGSAGLVQGTVSNVSLSNGKIILSVDGTSIPLENITRVEEASVVTETGYGEE